jgi:fructokinase
MPMARMTDIVALGELILDMFPAETGRGYATVSAFKPVPGGAPANVAVAAARLGCRTAFIGKVGQDPFGHLLADALNRNGVDTRGMRFDLRARTTLNFMTKPTVNRTECLFYRNPGADALLTSRELDTKLLRSTKVFHFGSISLIDEPVRSATKRAASIARKAGALLSLDVNYRPTLWRTPQAFVTQVREVLGLLDILKVNEEELAILSGTTILQKGCAKLLNRGPGLVVVTRGPAGCWFSAGCGQGSVPGFRVKTVDSTGCGDTFIAALLSQFAENRTSPRTVALADLRTYLRYANAAGAVTATKLGVIPSLPTSRQVESLLAKDHG